MKRILLMSDIHNCHMNTYGVSNDERMQRLFTHLNEEYRRAPYEMLLMLGDYSLDFWEYDILGSFLREDRSYTREFVEKYCHLIPSPWKMIAGNHEQYGEEKWREITGCNRRECWATDGWLFLLLDSFAANLDPAVHSDGTFTPIDVAYVREKMAEYPDHRVILCAHHFDFDRETQAAKDLIRDKRIVCLFSGHVHRSDILTLPEELGGKKILRTGQYSYSAAQSILDSMWGYREVCLYDDRLTSRYITPENSIHMDGKEILHPYGAQDEIVIPL